MLFCFRPRFLSYVLWFLREGGSSLSVFLSRVLFVLCCVNFAKATSVELSIVFALLMLHDDYILNVSIS